MICITKALTTDDKEWPGSTGPSYMDKSFTRTFIEAGAALLFCLIAVSQLQPSDPMEQTKTKEQQIESINIQIKDLSERLPFAEGQQYNTDRAKIAELRAKLRELQG